MSDFTVSEAYLACFTLDNLQEESDKTDNGDPYNPNLQYLRRMLFDANMKLLELSGADGWDDLITLKEAEGGAESIFTWLRTKRGGLVRLGFSAASVDAMTLAEFVAALRGENPATPNSDGSAGATKSTHNRSTSEENLEKVISALCSFHVYENGFCDDLVPKTARDLAKAADVSEPTMSRKLTEIFGKGPAGGYRNYQIACQSKTLGAILASRLDESPSDAHELQEPWGTIDGDRRRRPKGSELTGD